MLASLIALSHTLINGREDPTLGLLHMGGVIIGIHESIVELLKSLVWSQKMEFANLLPVHGRFVLLKAFTEFTWPMPPKIPLRSKALNPARESEKSLEWVMGDERGNDYYDLRRGLCALWFL